MNVATVGVVHPLQLSPEVKANWGQTLSDYEIIPPFPQIDRDTYTLQPEEVEVEEIKRFQAVQIPSVTLARMMESRGWLKGVIHDNGDYSVHYKYEASGRSLYARVGFNVIATANTRDRGVNEMSAALKRRFNFETMRPITDLRQEMELVQRETNRLLNQASIPLSLSPDLTEVLVTTFRELRTRRLPMLNR